MKNYIPIFILAVFFSSCNFETPTQFSETAKTDVLNSLSGGKASFKEVIGQYQGKKVLIDIWASWCADCVKGMPTIKRLQREFPEVVFLFLSVDKKNTAWKRGIQRFEMIGEHYNLPKGMRKGDFVDFVNLKWIPRYMVIDEIGEISLFKATNSSDKSIESALRKIQ
jgi:thiol-disulfide isomerase/thioredoxin|tara:strand:+ start:145 stop:645 length:501 start_codon:yes stop_codon:yes gene_type:complete